MGFFKALFGKTELPKSRLDRLFDLVSAQMTLDVELGWEVSGRAGICLKPLDSGDFAASEADLLELLRFASGETETKIQVKTDAFDFRWLLFADPDLDDLINMIHMAGQTLGEHGYNSQLLSAVFGFKRARVGGRPGLLIYNYKRAAFYPFVPVLQADKQRDNAEELHVAAVLGGELPIERDQSRWYALWDSPV